ncbi:25015_t:CDS:2 [Dentiscutata erythropus]|uniref:25015_t:CDS:1 n=1 Tax=Dentiscutata erythropus TaxID=1348616 RepID=A0A9N8ZLW0_9GLOM|nr:25015_t:CDS:2 [Dentiscutata erythropus]
MAKTKKVISSQSAKHHQPQTEKWPKPKKPPSTLFHLPKKPPSTLFHLPKKLLSTLSPPKKAAVNFSSLKKAAVNSLSPLSSDKKVIKTKPTPTSVRSLSLLSSDKEHDISSRSATSVAQPRSVDISDRKIIKTKPTLTSVRFLSLLSSDEEHDISSRSATSVAQPRSVNISSQSARHQPTSFTQTRSVNSLPPLSLSREHKNQQSWRNIDEILAVQRQQEHSISTIENTLNDLLSSLESLNSKIDSLSRAGSQRELEVGETSAAVQQRQFKIERERKNALRKMTRRASAYKHLRSKKDSHIMSYDLDKMREILGTSDAHSPELSDTDNEIDDEGNIYVNICDLSWRSQELCELFHDVFDTTMVLTIRRTRGTMRETRGKMRGTRGERGRREERERRGGR